MTDEFNPSISESEFLIAQTGSHFGGNGFTDWDTYIIRSSINFGSPLAASSKDTLRPETSTQITEISARLLKAFTTPEAYMKFLGYRGDSAQDLLDLLQKLLDHAPLKPQFRVLLYVALVRLCRKSGLCPRSYHLQDVKDKEEYPHSAGYFGDVYKAYYQGKPVCLKVVRLYYKSNQPQVHKAFSREAVIWAQLSHPNILPFYGIHFLSDSRKSFCLVSPWVFKGNVLEFLVEKPNAYRPRLIYGIAAGVEYLHKNGVVHGDLKSLNILVAEPEQALLTDFGFSYVTDDNGLQGPAFSSSHARGGTRTFEAPERLEDPESRRTRASDVFAFGMVCYELFTHPPLANVRVMSVSSFHSKIVYAPPQSLGPFPEYSGRGLTKEIWQVIESCWSHNPDARPSATTIIERLPSVEIKYGPSEWTHPWRPGFESSKEQVDDTIEKALSHLRTL